MAERKKQRVIRVSPETHDRLVAYCERVGRFIHRVSEEIIEAWLDEHAPEKGQLRKKGGAA